jgi:phage/plasmid-associated DNA primase
MSVDFQLKPGEIRLDLIPSSWPLTPLGADKAPYIVGWQRSPLSVSEIADEIYENKAKAVGLISGPVGNEPYGLVWVDVDGPSAFELVETLSTQKFEHALPKTLAISSGREGRVRKLYKVKKTDFDVFARSKYRWLADTEKGEQLEVLWSKRQGVLMGKHPDTKGFYTLPGEGFEHCSNLPEVPEWLVAHIAAQNKKKGTPTIERQRYVGMNFAINSEISVERDIRIAEKAIFALPQSHCDTYESWISAGQALHSIDDSCLEIWDKWSQQSDKYKPGACAAKWKTFDREGGAGLGSLIEEAKKYGFSVSQEYKAHSVSDKELDAAEQYLKNHEMAQELDPIEALGQEMENFLREGTLLHQLRPQKDSQATKPRKQKGSLRQNQIHDLLVQAYNDDLRYCKTLKQFRLYDPATGHWVLLDDQRMGADIMSRLNVIERSGLIEGYDNRLINDLKNLLSNTFNFTDWYEDREYLLFSNGVLHVPSKKLITFENNRKFIHDLYLINRQPYPYDEQAVPEKIIKWLYWTQEDKEDRVQLLRAFLRAVLLQHHEVQRFLEIVGYGKTGKSTFANLCVALVGRDNMATTNFKEMESNKFELTNFAGKKLIVLPDQDKYGGSVGVLKNLSGGDMVRNEVKNKADVTSFQYKGMIIITANAEIQSTDKSTGLQRRRITLYFNRVFQGRPSEQRNLISFTKGGTPIGDFAEELSGLINWLISMPEETMKDYLMATSENVDGYHKEESDRDRRVSTLHDWLGEHVIYDPNYWTGIGVNREKPFGAEGNYKYHEHNLKLYPSYLEHCSNIGQKATSRNNFLSSLIEYCRTNNLDVTKADQKRTKGLKGLRLRNEGSTAKENDWPSVLDYVNNKAKYKNIYEK